MQKSVGTKKQRDGGGVNLWIKQIAIVLGFVFIPPKRNSDAIAAHATKRAKKHCFFLIFLFLFSSKEKRKINNRFNLRLLFIRNFPKRYLRKQGYDRFKN